MLENAIDATYLTGIHDSAHGFGARNLIDVFRYLFATYGSIGPDEILRNHQQMTTPIDANHPIAILFKQIEDCQKFAAAGQVAITPAQVLLAAETLILQTGKYTSAYREWIALDPNAKTYHNFKIRMTAEYQLQNTMTTTARDAGYHHHANSAQQNPADEESLASAAQDFAAASAADSAAFEQLTSTNGNLNTQLAHMAIQNQQLQQQMSEIQQHVMFLATTQPPPQHQHAGRGGRGRPRHHQRGQHRAPAHYQAPPAYRQPMPPYGPPPQQYQPPPPLPYRPALPPSGMPPPPGFYQHQPPAPPARGGYMAPPPYQAPYPPAQQHRPPNSKRYNNLNYCWTHGADVTDSHRSDTCQRPAQYHQPQATRYNPMGGCQTAMHKVYTGT
jgi:hypothetical protein